MQAYAHADRAGKVRAIGASNLTPARLKASLAASKKLGLPRYESLQPLYNLSDRKEFETEFAPICRQEKLGVINYYSLAAGFLTGKYRSAEEAAKHPGARRAAQALSRRARLAHSRRRSMRWRRGMRDAGADRAGLADRAAADHRADRQRHQPQAARRNHEAPQIKLTRDDIAALDTAGACKKAGRRPRGTRDASPLDNARRTVDAVSWPLVS